MLHLIIINYDYTATDATANEWLNHADDLTSWAEHLQAAGVQVTVFQRFLEDDVLKRNDVTYHLVADTFAARLSVWQIPRTIHWSARVLCMAHVQVGHATLVQVNGLRFPLQIRCLRALLPSACPIVVQQQGEQPWSAPWSFVTTLGLSAHERFPIFRAQSGAALAATAHYPLAQTYLCAKGRCL